MDYDFLNNYLGRITDNKEVPDDGSLDDDNDFYDIPEQKEEDTSPDWDQDSEETDSDDYSNDNSNDSYNGGGGQPIYGEGFTPSSAEGEPTDDIRKSISARESQGKYTASNKHSSAVGKYQFLWSAWGDSIKKVTGVNTKEEFRNDPKAQEQYYSWYEKNYLMPQVKKLKQYNTAGLTDQELARLVHFRGAGGAKKYLQGKLADKPEKYNMSISKYIGTRMMGGHGIASSASAQRTGLNNANYDSMYFPMEGENEFTGLDDGSPVELTDEDGKKKILKGKKHKTIMRGNVFEKRI